MNSSESLEANYGETLTFKGRLLPKLPTNYTEPLLHNQILLPYGAVPANPYLDDAVKAQQKNMKKEFMLLHTTPPQDMPREFVEDVVIADYEINDERRKMENFEVFMKFIQSETPIDPSLLPEIELFQRGQSRIDGIATIAEKTEIEAVEFGEVGHPYGYRMQHLGPFRQEMNDVILAHGGVVYPTVAPYRSIKILPRVKRFYDGTEYGGQRIVGFIVKYKRDYGHIPVGDDEVIRVVERQIAAYRVDEASGFDQTVLAAMHQLRDTYPKRIHWDVPPTDNEKEQQTYATRLKMTGCADFIESAVQTDALDDFVVPLSTTIYGYREKLVKTTEAERMARVAVESALNSRLDLMSATEA